MHISYTQNSYSSRTTKQPSSRHITHLKSIFNQGHILLNGVKIRISKSIENTARNINKLTSKTGIRAKIVSDNKGNKRLQLVSSKMTVNIIDPKGILKELFARGKIGKGTKKIIQIIGNSFIGNRVNLNYIFKKPLHKNSISLLEQVKSTKVLSSGSQHKINEKTKHDILLEEIRNNNVLKTSQYKIIEKAKRDAYGKNKDLFDEIKATHARKEEAPEIILDEPSRRKRSSFSIIKDSLSFAAVTVLSELSLADAPGFLDYSGVDKILDQFKTGVQKNEFDSLCYQISISKSKGSDTIKKIAKFLEARQERSHGKKGIHQFRHRRTKVVDQDIVFLAKDAISESKKSGWKNPATIAPLVYIYQILSPSKTLLDGFV